MPRRTDSAIRSSSFATLCARFSSRRDCASPSILCSSRFRRPTRYPIKATAASATGMGSFIAVQSNSPKKNIVMYLWERFSTAAPSIVRTRTEPLKRDESNNHRRDQHEQPLLLVEAVEPTHCVSVNVAHNLHPA